MKILTMRWWYLGFAGVLAITGFCFGFLPLFNSAGFEFAAVLTILATPLGGFVAIAVVRLARLLDEPMHPVRAWALSCFLAALPLALAFLLCFAHAARPAVRNCTPGESLGFFALMPLSSAFFAAAVGVVLARGTRSPRVAGFLFVAVAAGNLLRTGFRMLDGPAIFFGNHFFGFFPGPLYDEAAPLDTPLFYLRFLSGLLALLLLHASAIFPDVGPWEGRRAGEAPSLLFAGSWRRSLAATLALAVVFSIASSFRRDFRLDIRRADVQAALGGVTRTEHFEIWHDAALKPDRVKLLEDDHEYRWHAVTSYLGVTPSRRITSYVFPDEAAKKRWTGAGGTQVANPFRGEIYLNGAIYPHAVLEHELAHAVSAEFGIQPFGVSASVGLLEGIAVASSWHDTGRGNPHEQSAAMLAENLLPDAESFLGISFWGGRQARSYTAAGSFVRFLGDEYGMDRVRSAYAWAYVPDGLRWALLASGATLLVIALVVGLLARRVRLATALLGAIGALLLAGAAALPRSQLPIAMGKPIRTLDAEWRAFLAEIPVPPAKKTAARERFTQPSLFERPCARELARLEEAGWAALRASRYDAAAALFERWRTVDERPEPIRALFHTARRRGDLAGADALAAKLLDLEIERSPMWWRARVYRAEIAAETGRVEEAERIFDEILGAGVTADLERESWIKREAVRATKRGDGEFGTSVMRWFDATLPRDSVVSSLAVATERASGRSRFVGAYLLGRALLSAYDARGSIRWLDDAAASAAGVDSPALLAELHALRADANTRLGAVPEADAAWGAVLGVPGVAPDAVSRAQDGRARLDWLTDRFDALQRANPTAP